MKNDRRFDEVMIVNPYDPANRAGEGANVMQFHYAPGYGYYAAAPYGYYADDSYGSYADDYSMGCYGEPPEVPQWGEADVQQVTLTPAADPDRTVECQQTGIGSVRFHHAAWSDLPTLYHVVNALAELPCYRAARRIGHRFLWWQDLPRSARADLRMNREGE